MKKNIFILCLFLLISFYGESHIMANSGMSYRVVYGKTVATVRNIPAAASLNERNMGTLNFADCFGLLVKKGLSENLSLRFGAIYAQKGAWEEIDRSGIGEKDTVEQYSYNVIELPLECEWTVLRNGGIELGIYGGGFVSYALEKKYEFTSQSSNVSNDWEASSTDFGLSVGLDFSVGFENLFLKRLHLDLRYTLGLSDLDSSKDGSNNSDTVYVLVGLGI